MRWVPWRRFAQICAAAALTALAVPSSAVAKPAYSAEDLAKLTPEQRERLSAYLSAQAAYQRKADRYWSQIEAKRAARRKKAAASAPIVPADYIAESPPPYDGPLEPGDVFKIIAKPAPVKPREPIPGVADFLRHAEEQFGFAPLTLPDEEFKRRYAREAIRLGISQDQVVRVYALETGGHGTFDMQSGYIHATKTTKPISTALGYAQLLSANSIEMLKKHGGAFIKRLETMAGRAPNAARATHLRNKAATLRTMLKAARGVPATWPAHVQYGGTPKGMGIHALNLDGDIGPWMQIEKLDSIRAFAAGKGRASLTGGELELLNLAGPGRGFEMLQPEAKDASTANFFERGGYSRNPVVHKRTASELLIRLDQIMDRNRNNDGAKAFDAIFTELKRELQGRLSGGGE